MTRERKPEATGKKQVATKKSAPAKKQGTSCPKKKTASADAGKAKTKAPVRKPTSRAKTRAVAGPRSTEREAAAPAAPVSAPLAPPSFIPAPRARRRRGPPPEEGRVVRIERREAVELLNGYILAARIDTLLGDATDFYLVEWKGTLPFGLEIAGREIRDLDLESETVKDTEENPIGRFQFLDPEEEDDSPDAELAGTFCAVVWCSN